MWIDYSGSGGNLAVVGGPQAGKSMGLRAGIAGLALTHTPMEVGFYVLDFVEMDDDGVDEVLEDLGRDGGGVGGDFVHRGAFGTVFLSWER